MTAAVMVLGFGATASAAPPGGSSKMPPDGSYRIWTWNVGGWKIHRGSTNDGLIGVMADSIRSRADFAAVNELCWSQYKALQANLRASEWGANKLNFSRFEKQRDDICGDEEFGLAIFSKAPMGTANRYLLASDGTGEDRKLLCAPLKDRPHLRFCTTHITTKDTVINGQKINETQLGQVLSRLESFNAAEDTVIIAGDFNAQPHYGRLNSWYSSDFNVRNNSGNTGNYRELDDLDERCVGYGETTTPEGNTQGLCGQGKKIDLIFVRASRLSGSNPYTGDSLSISTDCGGPCSDHRIVVGRVDISIN